MDGVDVAMVVTDGERVSSFGPTLYRAYTDAERDAIRAALVMAREQNNRAARPAELARAEAVVTRAHAESVNEWRRKNPDHSLDLLGFHGQTVFHAPERGVTIQLGDGKQLATMTGVPVVFDFRAADVAAGGEGAPFVPVFHQALAGMVGLSGNIAVVNIGGVANITRIGAGGSLVAGDTGPGNALIDDFVRLRTGVAMDVGGAIAAQGTVNEAVVAGLMDDPWFERPFPKSLDRDSFSAKAVSGLSSADGAATLAAFTSRSVVKGIVIAGGADRLIVAGGGSHNPVLMRMLAADAGVPVQAAGDLGWSQDFMEAQAFAYLAARSMAGLPLSFPETTGVPEPMAGGVFALP